MRFAFSGKPERLRELVQNHQVCYERGAFPSGRLGRSSHPGARKLVQSSNAGAPPRGRSLSRPGFL
jgi:hypothetical protein